MTPQISVLSLDYPSPSILDPTLAPGSILNISIQADNLPPITDLTTGGLQGFDMTVDYNSSLLKPVMSGSISPFCPDSDGCLFTNQTQTQVYNFANKISPNGSLRFGMIVYNQQNRVSSQGILFKIEFQIINRGYTPITIDQGRSQLIGYSSGCGSSLTGYTVSNATFDNRLPWRVIANPSTISVARGSSGSVNVTVIRVNSDGNVTLLIPAGNKPITRYQFTPETGTLNLQTGELNFTSTLTFTLNSTATSFTMQINAHETNSLSVSREYRLNYTVTVPTMLSPLLADQPSRSQLTLPSLMPIEAGPGLPALPLVANFTYTTDSSDTLTLLFSPTVCGGIGPYTYRWNFGDGTTSSSEIARHSYPAARSYHITFSVSDSNGTSFTSTGQTVTVMASSPSSASGPLLIGALVILAIIVLGGTAYYRRRTKRSLRK